VTTPSNGTLRGSQMEGARALKDAFCLTRYANEPKSPGGEKGGGGTIVGDGTGTREGGA